MQLFKVATAVAGFLFLITVFVTVSEIFAKGADEKIHLDFTKHGLSAHIENASIKTIVKKIVKNERIWIKGVEKLVDEKYSVQFHGLSIPDALKRILSAFNYCFIFDRKGGLSGIIIVSRQGGVYNPAPKVLRKAVRRIRRR